MIDRREFLGRSVLSAGSVLFSSVLLQSCTKYGIPLPGPNPKPPIIPPLLGDTSGDWNNNAKLAVTTALQLVPDVGGLVSALIDIVWPSSGDSPWDQVKAQVEALINQKLADDDYNRVTGNLAGLRSVIKDYKTQVDLSADIKTTWINAYTNFDLYQPNFQQLGDEVLLLPLFAQFANLYLGLLRDPLIPVLDAQGNPILDSNGNKVLTGTTWGMTDGEIQNYAGKLANKISEFTTYTTNWYTSGRAPKLKIPRDDKTLEPFRSTNAYDRQMTMLVLDYMDSWPYYDVTKYPDGATINPADNTPIHLFTREVYSDPYGNRINVDRITPPFALPSLATQFPTQITVWGGQRIDAVQLTYPAGGGPNGVTTTPRMGDQNGGTNIAPVGGWFSMLSDQYISSALISYDFVVSGPDATMAIDTLQFLFGNNSGGILSNQMGLKPGQYKLGNIGFNYYALSSIYIDGENETKQNSANCIVFGFMRWPLR